MPDFSAWRSDVRWLCSWRVPWQGGVTTYTYTYTYTSAGDLAELVDPAGLITRYGYDELGRKSSETVVSKTTLCSWPGP
ncbi:RHS repeat domain-containing protein [Saccharopolyspora shandongensis]|uniref:RHS repeat domain-containing protein n=1 Tax=Saccharopolyspora shandongensis TaxID=418495 RepID=UPI003432C214